MNKFMLTLTALVCAASVQSQTLQFRGDNNFKIAQFTDTHIDLGRPDRRAMAEKTLAQITYICDTEHPDMVVFTGDIVTGEPATEAWNRILKCVNDRKIPFFVTLGNHDAEQDISRCEIAQIVTSYSYSLNRLNAAGELSDEVLEIKGKQAPATLLYCLDSHDYSTVKGIGGYGWFSPEQITWYRTQSAKYTAANGGLPLPALAFFHIALPEYVEAWQNPKNTRKGRRAENECPGSLNAGMFQAFVQGGDVMGTFVGHDHDIDYVVAHRGIALGYGRFSGDETTYTNLRHGARLIVLEQGKRGFETWIRERDGRVVDHVTFSDGKIEKYK